MAILLTIIALPLFFLAGVLSVGYWYPPQGHQAKTDKPVGKLPQFKSSVRRGVDVFYCWLFIYWFNACHPFNL